MSQTFQVDQKVIVRPEITRKFPGVWIVTKVPTRANEVNYVLEPVDGGRGLRIHGEYLAPFTGETPSDAFTTVPPPPRINPGAVGTIDNPRWKGGPGPFVVLDQRPDGSLRLVKLGGDPEGRYWTKVSAAIFTVIENPTLAALGEVD
jgi:hypothetical protein